MHPLRPLLFLLLLLPASCAPTQSPTPSSTDLYQITAGTSDATSAFHQLSIPRGTETTLALLTGPGKITYFYITDDTVGKWYPGLVLKIFWDDAKDPSISVPLADFFGAIAGQSVDYQSAVMQINHACFASHLPMPFSKSARVVLANDGDRDYSQKLAFGIDHELNPAYATESSRLHCEYRRSNPVTNGLHTILQAHGHGQYVGSFLQTTSRSHAVWFGEGDTIFHLDNKTINHSPGTEDEYGSCWEDPRWRTFASPYAGHPLNNDGTNRMYRWYITNPVRFQKSLTVEIQNQHDNGKPTTTTDADDYTSLAFWYQEGPQKVSPLPTFQTRTAPSFSNTK